MIATSGGCWMRNILEPARNLKVSGSPRNQVRVGGKRRKAKHSILQRPSGRISQRSLLPWQEEHGELQLIIVRRRQEEMRQKGRVASFEINMMQKHQGWHQASSKLRSSRGRMGRARKKLLTEWLAVVGSIQMLMSTQREIRSRRELW